MQATEKADSNSFLRKIITIVFLPIIIMLWITGWTLTQIGSAGRPTEIKQKITHPAPEAHEKSDIPKAKDDSRLTNEPIIA